MIAIWPFLNSLVEIKILLMLKVKIHFKACFVLGFGKI